ncbi:DUF3862 domain-containing protein [Virgibacillus sp. AGTR]|uniref:DUF3862 domain-containing protein n=1 Tax=unclassified Virgibacillus TaxID=2620237 RepID=UPI001964D431|nr:MULTISPECIES: DUF3862 domain-containing protein [unclassified Virgibacillus]MCC2248778.1 DUF3862 domain-containing protein [Virgibacillus sp. AGTR]MDY7045748.1 DUF3862 domain-containing protein [Virgibacillus sp. M23]QRZ17932.1 DUF3862 domain-containing protein [Virgibacillus sp. AGTR]
MKVFPQISLMFILVAALLTGCDEGEVQNPDGPVTIQQYNQLENRMEFDDVIDMLGQPDLINFQENTEDEVEFIDENTLYSWDGAAPDSGITLRFRDGKLSSKEQVGLE